MTNEHSPVLIHMQNLNKICKIGNTLINVFTDVNFKIYMGEYVAFTGLHGKVRDSFLKILGCIHKADSGKYYFDYDDICCANQEKIEEIRNQKIGFVFHDFKLIDYLSIIENVALPLKYSNISPEARNSKAKEALAKVDFCGDIYSKPNETTDYDKQKAAIARALINDPLIVIADEPTYHLDADSTKGVLEILKSINHEGVTIAIASSQMEIIHQAHRVLSFSDGSLVSDGSNDIHSFEGEGLYES